MPQVVVTIDGKTYRMACAEGEEPHLAGLAAEVDGRVAELRRGFGEIGDLRLTVMTAIMITDELSEARRKIAELEASLAAARHEGASLDGHSQAQEAVLAKRLDEAAESVEAILARLGGR